MNDKYNPPLFLTGKLPKRNTEEIIWLILCLGRLKIFLSKDIYRMIHNELYEVRLVKTEVHNPAIKAVRLGNLYDFVIVEPKTDGKIIFNDVYYCVSRGKYVICMSLLPYVLAKVDCEEVKISSWSFRDNKSSLYKAFKTISAALNSDLNGNTLIYLSGTIRNNENLIALSERNIPDIQKEIELCVKHDIISLNDPLSRKAKYYIEENGRVV